MAIPFDNIKKYVKMSPTLLNGPDVILKKHSRMMAYPYPKPYPRPSASLQVTLKRPSFYRVARNIVIQDGVAGFFRGLTPCFLRAFPVNASALFVYEGTMRVLGAEQVRLSRFSSAG